MERRGDRAIGQVIQGLRRMYREANNYAFIDGSNLHLTYEHMDWKMNYAKLRKFLRKRHGVTIAYYFVGYRLKNSDTYQKLRKYGYILKHEIADNLDDYLIRQAKWDMDKYDKAVIISSDKHFAELISYLDSQDKLKLVLAPCNQGCSTKVRKAANTKIEFLSSYQKELQKSEG